MFPQLGPNYWQNQIAYKKDSTKQKNAKEEACSDSTTTNQTKSQSEENKVGTGSWNSKAIQDAGIDLGKYKKYFIGVYTDYYRFNPDTIKADFPNKSIQSPADLKAAIDELENGQKKTVVGTGSWSGDAIDKAGIDLYENKQYFIGVYTNYYRFNPETIAADFPGKTINNLADLKAAIEEKKSTESTENNKTAPSEDDMNKAYHEAIEKATTEYEYRKHTIESRIDYYKEQCNELQDQINKVRFYMEHLKEEFDSGLMSKEDYEQTINECQTQIGNLQEQIAEIYSMLNSLEEELSYLENNKSEIFNQALDNLKSENSYNW